jgi:DNA-binding MarR family transcriptional regulator
MPSSDSVGYLIKRVQQALRNSLDSALADLGLTTAQYNVLFNLSRNPGASSAELTRQSFVKPQTMIRIVRGLEHRGFLARNPSTRNRHILEAHLTVDGARVLRAAQGRVDSIQSRMLARIQTSDVERLASWLSAMASELEDEKHGLVSRTRRTQSGHSGSR